MKYLYACKMLCLSPSPPRIITKTTTHQLFKYSKSLQYVQTIHHLSYLFKTFSIINYQHHTNHNTPTLQVIQVSSIQSRGVTPKFFGRKGHMWVCTTVPTCSMYSSMYVHIYVLRTQFITTYVLLVSSHISLAYTTLFLLEVFSFQVVICLKN